MNYPVQQQYPQQGYPQPQAPAYPPQYPQQPGAPAPAAYPPQYPAPAPQGYPQQGYAPQPQQPPAQPLATGTLDDYYSQPSSGGGPSISWSINGIPKPDGTWYVGVVARDVTNSDIQQQTDPKSGAPKFYRDGRPQFVMKVPLRVQASPEHPDGEATLFVRGQMRDELTRAMQESGVSGAPKAGDGIQVTLTSRKPSRGGGAPMNVFAITYTPAGGRSDAVAPPQAQQPRVPQQAPAPGAPSLAPGQPAQQYQQPQPVAQVRAEVQQPQQYAPQPVQQYAQAPVQQIPEQPQQQFVQQPQVPQGAPQPPSDLAPDAQALLAQLTANQQPAA